MIWNRPIEALFAAVLIAAPAAHAAPLARPAQSPPQALENPLATLSLDQLAATQERPLFAPDRRRPTAASVVRHVEPPVAPPDPPKLSLFGLLVDPQGARVVVRVDPAGKILRLRLGDEVGGWRVTRDRETAIDPIARWPAGDRRDVQEPAWWQAFRPGPAFEPHA